VATIAALRRLRMTAAEIAETLAMPVSTVSAVLTRSGLGRLGRIGLEPARRYERSRPGELVHIDVKKLGRIDGGAGKRVGGRVPGRYPPRRVDAAGSARGTIGWEYVHVAVDDYSRFAYAEVLADERATTAVGFLHRACAFFARHGIRVERMLTDNGPRLPCGDPRACLPRPRYPPPAHAPASPADQRQGRALHPGHSSPAGPTGRSTAQAASGAAGP
jgi:hypothetical protein